ncbi:hypothetical protein SDC9_168938 [bioreactor metagenome]|uniref:Uncharacterized protein n=1 Tax=bioreactor metagenome TaxID=1076179 RepID=A0A645G3X1_9ZZZZ
MCAASGIKSRFRGDQIWPGVQFVREDQRLVANLSRQALTGGQRGAIAGGAFANVRLRARRVQSRQYLSRLDLIAFMHHQFGEDPPVERLQYLLARTGDHLAGARRDLIKNAEPRPHREDQTQDPGEPDDATGT